MKPSTLLRALRLVRFAVAAALTVAATPASAGTLKIDPQHSSVGFGIRHLFTKVPGRFRQFEGTIDFDEKSPVNSRVDVTVQAASIDTNLEARDKDLRSKRFFDVEKHPTLTFTSTSVSDVAGNRAKIKGLLTMHGVQKEVVLDAEFLGKAKDPWGNARWGFHATTRINRKDYGLAWNEVIEGGGLLVGDDVDISLDVEALSATP